MTEFLIYHNQQFMNYGYDGVSIFVHNLDLVAKVNANSLNHAFHFTNHVEHTWWRNPQVIWWRPSRSTSVGDVIHNMDDGSYHIVERFGFKTIHSWWIGAQLLEKDMPDEPQIHRDLFAVNRSPLSLLRRLVSRQLHHPRTDW